MNLFKKTYVVNGVITLIQDVDKERLGWEELEYNGVCEKVPTTESVCRQMARFAEEKFNINNIGITLDEWRASWELTDKGRLVLSMIFVCAIVCVAGLGGWL